MASPMTKLLSPPTGEAPPQPSQPATRWMKVLVFGYLSGWIGAVALVGFFYIADNSPPNSPAAASRSAGEGGDSAGTAVATAPSGGPAGTVDADGGATKSPAAPVVASKDGSLNEGKPRLLSDRRLFIWVVLLGILGGALHGLSSAAMHIGRRRCTQEWLFFYLSRPPVGGGVAAVLYLVLRGGIAGLHVSDSHEGEFTAMAWGAMAGLFSTVAMQKLRDIFDALFKPNQATNSGTTPPSSSAPVGGPATTLPPVPVQKPTGEVAPPPPKK